MNENETNKIAGGWSGVANVDVSAKSNENENGKRTKKNVEEE